MRSGNGLPSSWVHVPLGELGHWYGGGTPSKANDKFWSHGTIPWFSPKDMKAFRLQSSEDRITRAAVNSSSVDVFPPDTVLMVVRSGILAHTFPVAVAGVEATMNQDLKAVVPKDGVNATYLAYALRNSGRDILNQCSKAGTTVASIDTLALHRYSIPLAPTNEQQRVVEKLDELLSDLDAGIAALERARANLKRYRVAVLKAAVGGRLTEKWRAAHPDGEPAEKLLERILTERRKKWEEAQIKKFAGKGHSPLKGWKDKYPEPAKPDVASLPVVPRNWSWVRAEQVCDFITKGTTPPASMLSADSGDIPFIKVYNLTNRGVLDFSIEPTFIGTDTHRRFLARSRVFPGDVLMNIVGPPLGKVSIVPEQFPEWNINQAVAIFRPLGGLDRRYLAACLLSDVVLDWALERGKATAGQTNLTLEICRNLPLPLPPYLEQVAIAEEIARQISIIEFQSRVVEIAGTRSSRLRQSILKRAFEGKLVPQDPRDEPASELLTRIREGKNDSAPRKGKAAVRVLPDAKAIREA